MFLLLKFCNFVSLHFATMISRVRICIFISVTVLSLSILSCSGSKVGEHIPATSVGKNLIVIGIGGGFSGFYDGFALAENGNAYSWRSMNDQPDTLIFVSNIPNDSSRFFFQYLEEIGFASMVSNVGGNMNAFIEYQSGQGKHRVTWDQDNPPKLPGLSLFSSILRKHIERSVSATK